MGKITKILLFVIIVFLIFYYFFVVKSTETEIAPTEPDTVKSEKVIKLDTQAGRTYRLNSKLEMITPDT